MDDQTRLDTLRIEALRFAFADTTVTTTRDRTAAATVYLDFLANKAAQA